MVSKTPSEVEKGVARMYVPEWRALTKLEQNSILALFFANSAATWWELYGFTVAFIVYDEQGLDPEDYNEQLKRAGGLRNLIDKYRKNGIKLPAFKTFTNLLDDFVKAGWVGYRIDGLEPQQQEMMQEDTTGRLYYLKSEITNALKTDINNYLEVLKASSHREDVLKKARKFRELIK